MNGIAHPPPPEAGIGHGPPIGAPEHRRDLLRRMLLIRRFEERCAELYQEALIRGFLHLYIGEEAVATGVSAALEPDDLVVATYREHGHALVRDVPPAALMAEMLGKVEGCSRGRGGSMHLFDVSHGFYGGNAIVGGGLPLATGLALASSIRNEPLVTACFFGEGAVAEGEFHESMNLAALWRLPVVLCCENNLYAMGSAIELTESQTDLVRKASSYGMPAWSVDGMDVEAVERAAQAAVAIARGGDGPSFLELRTYRYRAHSMYDPERYRDQAEVEAWRDHDPIVRFIERLRADGVVDDDAVDELDDEVTAVIEDAVNEALTGTDEPVEDLLRFVIAERGEP